MNMRKVPVKNSKFFVLEGDLVERNGGIFPVTYLGIQLEGAPEEQVWVLNGSFFGYFEEDSVVSSHFVALEKAQEIVSKGHINLMDDFDTLDAYTHTRIPYGSTEPEECPTIFVAATINTEQSVVEKINR